jgi:hypothetical protein
VHLADVADDARLEPRRQAVQVGVVAVRQQVRHRAGGAGGVQRRADLVPHVGHRLVADHRPAVAQRGGGDGCVGVVRRDDDDAVQVRLPIQQLPEIGVRAYAAVAAAAVLATVVRLDDAAGDVAPGADAVVAFAP